MFEDDNSFPGKGWLVGYTDLTAISMIKCFTLVGHYLKNIYDSITYIGAFKHLERRGHYFYHNAYLSKRVLVHCKGSF